MVLQYATATYLQGFYQSGTCYQQVSFSGKCFTKAHCNYRQSVECNEHLTFVIQQQQQDVIVYLSLPFT